MVASSSSGSRDGSTPGRRGGGSGGGAVHHAVKKGPWTAAEDAILMEYVRKHGEGNWNAVQRNSGLMRCGKSCRLRWANHLRPNLRKGAFSSEEERLIIELHAKLGNKWARMASQLPGRTDNEIKNYWNTRVKRLQRAGLPIYPEDIQRQNDHPQLMKRHSSMLSPPPPSNSRFNSPSFSLFTPPNFPTMANPFLYHPNNNQFKLNSNITLPILPFSSSPPPPPSNLFSQSLMNNDLLPAYQSQYKSADFNPFCLELPSVQSPAIRAATTTPASSGTTGGDYMMGTTNDLDGDRGGGNNSGLLEELLEESKAMASAEKLKREMSFGDEGIEDGGNGVDEYSSSAHPSIGVKEEQLQELNPIDDDLSSLLNNFPMSGPVPDWPEPALARSNIEQPSHNLENENLNYDNNIVLPSGVPPPPAAAAVVNPKWGMGSCCWNNMPSIC